MLKKITQICILITVMVVQHENIDAVPRNIYICHALRDLIPFVQFKKRGAALMEQRYF